MRVRMSILFAAALCGCSLAAAAPPANAFTIKSAEILGSYVPSDAGHGSRRGRDLPAVIVGNPFPVTPDITAQAVSQGMRDGRPGPGLPLEQSAVAPLRVIWQLGGGTRTGNAICDRRMPLTALGAGGASMNVVATFCRGESAMTQVYGSADGVSDPRDPKFIKFINQMTVNLFPPHNPDNNGKRWPR
ncbi:MAG: hypothetical protein ACT4N4_03150 [Rhodospirillales bacterium]